jgi:hypothetical protein
MGLSNYLPSSRISQPGVCTSSTRPISPYEGQVIYETDTDRTLLWNGSSWYPPSASTLITSLPSTPTDGQIINYVADSTNGIVWTFRYRAASSSSYKWEFIGGPAAYSYVGPNDYNGSRQTISTLTFGDLATVGPSFTTPFAGDWDCTFNVLAETNGTATHVRVWATGDSSLNWNFGDSQAYNANQLNATHAGTIRRTGIASGSTLKLQYAVSNAGVTAAFWNRRLYVTPVRIG